MNGIINVFKSRGMTSHDVVAIMRKTLGIKKIGHTGTLDPNATGVLPICIGKGTRISEYLLNVDKEYIGELSLGIATDTQDSDGKIIEHSLKTVDKDEIYSAFNEFLGHIKQIPPMYSAVRHNGKKLYEFAREGKIVDRKSRDAFIYNLKIIDIIDNKKILFYAKCSRGTYIRTLCNDIGELLGTYGHMSYLIRIGVGDFKVADSYSIDYIRQLGKKNMESIICPMDEGLSHISSLIVEDKFFNALINGARILLPINNIEKYESNASLKIYCNDKFIGMGKMIIDEDTYQLKMDKVLI